MGIAAVLDIERLREVMTELMERSAAVVRRYGGTVESTGDGVMAIFGRPVALEDHAFRACLAALAIQEDSQTVGDRSQASRRRGAPGAGGTEFRSGHRRRYRLRVTGVHAR
jgi:class 3 adenylate cyclase